MLNKNEYGELMNTTDCINALCEQKPMMIINTQCGTGKYRFKKVGYKDGGLLMEFILIHDSDFEDTEKIFHKIGDYCYLTVDQFLYAYKNYVSA
tara:strand:+ start:921 stop:1202 length:282 start_codon:yes stop_codon:yes gene_type:complete